MSDGYFSIELERDELNRYFGGGIPKNSLILLEGVDGAGKSLVCQRLTYSLLQNKNELTYISTELNTLDFIKQMDSLNYSIRNDLLYRRLMFITLVPFLGTVKFEEDFIEKIIKSPKLFEKEVIIFDTLSFLLVKKDAGEEAYYKIMNFFRKLNNLNKTVIFTVDPSQIDEKFLMLLRNMSDLFIQINLGSFGGETTRVMSVKRFKRPKDIFLDKISFRVEPKEGLIIEIGGFS
ncbi:MAG: ATPase domain-containing protein [Candidatus Nanoarchaeia archaeon]